MINLEEDNRFIKKEDIKKIEIEEVIKIVDYIFEENISFYKCIGMRTNKEYWICGGLPSPRIGAAYYLKPNKVFSIINPLE